jgi:hypothetical protein
MNAEHDKQFCKKFINECSTRELVAIASFAICNFPVAEVVIRKALIVVVSLTKPEAGK